MIISAPSDLHFGIIAFFTRLLTIIYIFGNMLIRMQYYDIYRTSVRNFDVKEMVRVGLVSTTFSFPCLRSYQLSYRSDMGTEAFEIVYTVYTVYTVEFIQ